eukprot:TRINITY_DN5441_c0_g1_i2.p1 TRINITY_DN5441_c0_g1~~TRINITY_DN5441_c0_g1_i2.p1  ORF type:complete len:291 (-),score=51.34 TRINITY_DN5441_c0_g1_i2:264-1136(-)
MEVNCKAIILLVAFAVSIASNGLASTGVFGKTIKQISDENPTFVTPDGTTFAVWGLIYTLWTILVVKQFCPSEEAEELLSQRCKLTTLTVYGRLVAACLTNAIWLPVYVSEYFTVALVIIVVYWMLLGSIYLDVNTTTVSSFIDWLAYAAPIAANASWVTVATCANAFTVGRVAGWKDEFGVGGTPEAAMVVSLLVALLASYLGIAKRSVMWAAVAAWALQGISRMQTVSDPQRFPVESMSDKLAKTAFSASFAPMLAGLIGLGLALRDARNEGNKGSDEEDSFVEDVSD